MIVYTGAVFISARSEDRSAIYPILRDTLSEFEGAQYVKGDYRDNQDVLFFFHAPEHVFQALILKLPSRRGITLIRLENNELNVLKGTVRPIEHDIGKVQDYQRVHRDRRYSRNHPAN